MRPAGFAVLAGAGALAGVLTAVLSGAPSAELTAPAGNAPHAVSALPGLPSVHASAGGAPRLTEVTLTVETGASLVYGSAVPAVRPVSRPPTVAPLRRSVRADLLIVAPFSLRGKLLRTVAALPGVVAAERIEAVRMPINGSSTAVLGVDPSQFRSFAEHPTGAANALWQGVAGGGIAVSYSMGKLDKIPLGGTVVAAGRTTKRLRVVAFGTLGIGGVNAVVSDATARALGAPAGNAIVLSTRISDFTADLAAIGRLLPKGAGVEQLVTLVAGEPVAAANSMAGAGPVTAGAVPPAQIDIMLRAAMSRQGLPYVWGGAGPSVFDCSGLVQWSFAQAGITMPRVAADQALSGPSVPVDQLQPGDLLFYHTDPTAPGYISHVAILIGNGLMIQAPEPGKDVEVVPAEFGPEFAGAIRVSPAEAAAVAARVA
jgi:cell wall-associated NlpC family hydrolase